MAENKPLRVHQLVGFYYLLHCTLSLSTHRHFRPLLNVERLKFGRVLELRGAADEVEEVKLNYSLREMQRATVEELIARVNPDNATACGPWKTLFFDSHWRDVLTMVLKPSDLQLHGVVICQHLDERRDNLPYFPAVYFVDLENVNITRLADCVNEDRIESHYFYASGPVAIEKWEDLGQILIPELLDSRVKAMTEIFVDFISLGSTYSAPVFMLFRC
jgi:hypothetical protein